MEKPAFKIQYEDPSGARAAIIHTDHGSILTPVFMPVGTLASVKGINQRQLKKEINAQVILGNTYHLYLRPGIETFLQAGGFHKFMDWADPILTDSGGYQIFSLSNNRKISEEGVVFTSHIDGSKHLFNPENNIEVQRAIGADFIMAFDECTPYPCPYAYAKKSLQLTQRWLARGIEKDRNTGYHYDYKQLFIPIIQGSVYEDLRVQSTQEVLRYKSPIVAIGGLSVGEPEEDLYHMTQVVCGQIPGETGRYLMGVGTPWNLLECIERGIDMFDCVLPTRNARHGLIYTHEGYLQIKNQKWAYDFSPLAPNSPNEDLRKYSRAYVRHLIRQNEMLGAQIATMQNLLFFQTLMREARTHIIQGSFKKWKEAKVKAISKRL